MKRVFALCLSALLVVAVVGPVAAASKPKPSVNPIACVVASESSEYVELLTGVVWENLRVGAEEYRISLYAGPKHARTLLGQGGWAIWMPVYTGWQSVSWWYHPTTGDVMTSADWNSTVSAVGFELFDGDGDLLWSSTVAQYKQGWPVCYTWPY
jgi:hypothetical protein